MKIPTVLFVPAAVFVFSSVAVAGVTPAQKSPAPAVVTAAAAAVPAIQLQPQLNLADEEILAAASPIAVTTHGLSAHTLVLVSAAETDSPETGGLESDGPGGPDHQFEGEETGEH